MAKLFDPNPLQGTYGDITLYSVKGEFYLRMKSSLTAEEVRVLPVFEGTRRSAARLGRASKIASRVYKQLVEKKHGVYREMTGKAARWLKEGVCEEEVYLKLEEWYLGGKRGLREGNLQQETL